MEPKKNEQKKTIPNRIALLRKQMGMSQKELADIVGVVQSTISVWENGQVAIDSNTLPALSKALAVQVDYLLGLSDERQSNVRNALDTCNILSESCMDSRDSYYEYLYSIGIDVEKEKEEYLDHLHDVYMESESGVFFEAFQISKIFEHLNISERNRALEVIKLMFPQAAEKALTPDLSVLAAQHKKEQELNKEKEKEHD